MVDITFCMAGCWKLEELVEISLDMRGIAAIDDARLLLQLLLELDKGTHVVFQVAAQHTSEALLQKRMNRKQFTGKQGHTASFLQDDLVL